MHIPSLVKIDWYLLKLSFRNKNTDVLQVDNSVRIDEICPIAVLNQISTISMHIPSFILLKLSTGNKNMDK